jgi:transposase
MSPRRPMRWCCRSTRRARSSRRSSRRLRPCKGRCQEASAGRWIAPNRDCRWSEAPLPTGRAGTITHDYIRNGTTTLFAALNVLDGSVIGQCMQRHRHQEFLRFLNRLEREIPAGKLVHVILDNYASHKHPKVLAWLARHPRWTFHFTPTSASWLNAVEGFFAKLTNRRLKRGVFHSLVDLQAAINRYLVEHNQSPKPFVWTADPDAVIAAASRGYQALDSIH